MSNEQTGHDHTHGMAKQTLRLAFFLSLIIVAAEVTGGLFAHSLALLSDAGHALTDIFALGLAWFATAQAERPANARKTFGYHRVGILAALINAITLILVTIWILYEAVQRFAHPEPIQPLLMNDNISSRWCGLELPSTCTLVLDSIKRKRISMPKPQPCMFLAMWEPLWGSLSRAW